MNLIFSWLSFIFILLGWGVLISLAQQEQVFQYLTFGTKGFPFIAWLNLYPLLGLLFAFIAERNKYRILLFIFSSLAFILTACLSFVAVFTL